MPGPKQTKAICPRCKINKWAVDFKEGCFDKINPKSICLFCELKEHHKNELDAIRQKYDKEIKDLQETVESLLLVISGTQERGVDAPTYAQAAVASGVYRREPIIEGQGVKAKAQGAKLLPRLQTDKQKKNTAVEKGKISVVAGNNAGASKGTTGGAPTSRDTVCSQAQAAGRNENSFKKAVGKRAARPPAPNTEKPVKTTNRFGPLSSEEEFAVLVGDSQVRKQEKYFGAIQSSKRRITCLPGRKTAQLCKAVQSTTIPGRKSAIVAQVSGNDLFLKGNKVGNTEPIFRGALSLVEELERKTDRGMILGIIPRLYVSSYATSKLISLNERLADRCNTRAVKFVDPFNKFYGQRKLYQRDGVHLNTRGQAVLGDLINENLFSLYRASSREGHRQPSIATYSLTPRVVSQPVAQTNSGTRSPKLGRSPEEAQSHPTPELSGSVSPQRSDRGPRSTARRMRTVPENTEPTVKESQGSGRSAPSQSVDGGATGGPELPRTPDLSGNGESKGVMKIGLAPLE